ncbi:MAG: Crp/Fnr family transcriptional regulator [Caldilineaceae bacterium]|nr:Crp/Fnr family transcriptional regulator [Caldilineaceae bacterium]MBP8109421.1 Crp/Fnr family transcriptional regulator [Caldilineaceae bacterium]MBP8123996.1 Crp/Fnr family transcriptional regulator [Caldilineaceae bacterium]MBP9074065.1 Crp/Fnr family transcriptional regulator [Caldilineaceae bacterium]
MPTQRPHNDYLIQAIDGMAILSGLGAAGVREVAQAAIWREFAQGGIVFLEEEESLGLCHLYSGWLKVVKMSLDGREQVLRHLGPGETFNEVGALSQRPNPATVIALEPAGLWIIPRQAIQQIILSHPELAMPILANMANRMAGLVNLVAELSLHSVEARLARFLLEQASDNVMQRQPWATYAELAARLGTVPDVFSRALRSLSEAGLIQVDRQSIRILDRAGLESRANLV